MPDEHDSAWEHDATWSRAYLLIALADIIGTRRLEEGVGLVLDRMCLGDPDEMMRGMRHRLEAAISPNWSRLTDICVARCASERAGTRYWALDELGVLRDPAAMSAILRMFDDHDRDVAIAAFRVAELVLEDAPTVRPGVVPALRRIGQRRKELREEAEDCVRNIQRSAPATGKIDNPRLEGMLATAICGYRDGEPSMSGELSLAFEGLLLSCLGDCEEWDGSGVPDGLSDFSATMTSATTIDVRGQMTSFKGDGHCIEPFAARVTIAEEKDMLQSGEIKYGDAKVGIGTIPFGERPTRPQDVSAWLYVFTK